MLHETEQEVFYFNHVPILATTDVTVLEDFERQGYDYVAITVCHQNDFLPLHAFSGVIATVKHENVKRFLKENLIELDRQTAVKIGTQIEDLSVWNFFNERVLVLHKAKEIMECLTNYASTF